MTLLLLQCMRMHLIDLVYWFVLCGKNSNRHHSQILRHARWLHCRRYHGEDQSLERLMHEVRQIGFPILVKAARGGGGKGMKLAHREQELQACRTTACGAQTSLIIAHGLPGST